MSNPPELVGMVSKREPRRFDALDGLRGCAILMVMVFHYVLSTSWDLPAVTNWNFGWLGVDVFFVLSGFLITGILLDSLESPRYFKNFFARRVLRIVPVYYLTLAVIFLAFPYVIPFDTPQMHRLVRNQGWLWAHLTNWGFVYGSVFQHEHAFTWTDNLDLTHFWSLAVEEQFYLIWPFVVWCAGRKRLGRVCAACVVGALLLRIALWMAHQRNGALYFPTPCRVDGLALGGWVALSIRNAGREEQLRRWARWTAPLSIVALAGLGILRHGIQFVDAANVAFGITLAAVLTASVIVLIIPRENEGTLQKAMMFPPLRMLGKYSYGLYLFHGTLLGPMQYHFPAEAFIAKVGNNLLGNALYFLIFATVSLGVALVSWHAFEKHWLKLKRHFEYSEPRRTADPLLSSRAADETVALPPAP